LAALLAGLAVAETAVAAPPWQKVAIFKSIETDPEKDYPLTENQGPWLIMAITFSPKLDETAETLEQANELVLELRSRYKLNAYVYEFREDLSKGTTGLGVDAYGEPKRLKYQGSQEIHEFAVFVGNFASVDDPEAQRALKKIKAAQPDCLDVEKRRQQGKHDHRSLGLLRHMQREFNRQLGNQVVLGPMGRAFITANPLIPKEYFQHKGLDEFVVKMNEPVQYSLLKCRGKYTCKVATFEGAVLIEQDKIHKVEAGARLESRLEIAALQAHEMTMALRAKGYEAYEFHDRHASMVTVGSFDSVGAPRPDGLLEMNPKLLKVIETFSADKIVVPGRPARIGKPKDIVRIPFDIQAVPVLVPRQPVSSAYAKHSLPPR
jgi:hypothetical protein